MTLEWSGFRLSLGRDGLMEFAWIGEGVFETRVSRCVSAVLHPPRDAREDHRLVLRFRFPDAGALAPPVAGVGADGAESLVVRVDVPRGAVERTRSFLRLLWDDFSVPYGEGAGPAAAGAAPRADPVPVPGAAPAGGAAGAVREDVRARAVDPVGKERLRAPASPGGAPAKEGVPPAEPELERVPEDPAWIVSPAGPGSEELFRDVMARPAPGDR
ncbi:MULTISPECIES: hypothetical protein [unclassified Streptomyces]|uniref:hypothetical protein n=1 Tax=unclassified Streptomyces TaxID=2593676 RepID=UPI0036A5430F